MTRSSPPAVPRPNRLPDSPEAQRVLLERAERLSRTGRSAPPPAEGQLHLEVLLGERAPHALPYRFVEAITPATGLVPVPCTPPAIAGIVSRRGELLTVVDPRPLLGLAVPPPGEGAMVVVIRAAGIKAALLVQGVVGNGRHDPARLSLPLAGEAGAARGVVEGVHRGRLPVLNLDALLAPLLPDAAPPPHQPGSTHPPDPSGPPQPPRESQRG